jgi:hypothetical protein
VANAKVDAAAARDVVIEVKFAHFEIPRFTKGGRIAVAIYVELNDQRADVSLRGAHRFQQIDPKELLIRKPRIFIRVDAAGDIDRPSQVVGKQAQGTIPIEFALKRI